MNEHPAAVLLAARGHDGHPAAVVHFGFSDEPSFVGVRDADRPPEPLVGFLALPGAGSGVLEAVTRIDDAGRRVVDRFSTTFPDTVATLHGIEAGQPSAGLGRLLGLCSLLLDLRQEEAEQAMAHDQATVRVETAVIERDGEFVVDGRRLLRSLMSYRLADVPGPLLAASVFSSLGDFTGQAVRRLVRAWPAARVVACSGDLFAGNTLLREAADRSLAGVRRPVLFPG